MTPGPWTTHSENVALADVQGCRIQEKRFVDTARRYGAYPFTVARWNSTCAF